MSSLTSHENTPISKTHRRSENFKNLFWPKTSKDVLENTLKFNNLAKVMKILDCTFMFKKRWPEIREAAVKDMRPLAVKTVNFEVGFNENDKNVIKQCQVDEDNTDYVALEF